MKVPLIAEAKIIDNRQYIKIWNEGEANLYDPPFLPYILIKKQVGLTVEPASIEPVTVKPLSTLKESNWWKYSFPNTEYLKSINKSIRQSRFDMQRIRKLFAETKIEFRERIIIDNPEWFKQFPQKSDPRPFWFDIETATKDGADLQRVISIAYAGPDRVIYSKQVKYEECTDAKEKELILWLFYAIKDIDPDIIAGYYMKDFDFVYLFDRATKLGINYQMIARDNNVVYYNEGRYVNMTISGRILYDIFDSVSNDQTLFGIKSKGLKSFSKWMKFENVIEEDTSSTIDISIENLKIYNESDVLQTMRSYDVYFDNLMTQAEMFGVPLNMIMEASSSFLANIFQGVGLHKRSIISNGTNSERHPEIYARAKKDGESSKYQAAYVDIYKTGFFEKVWQVDYKGLYNAIEITANASPDTTRILRYEPFDADGFKFEKVNNTIFYYIPDTNINKVVVIEVNNEFDGLLRIELKRIREARAKIKEQMKTCTPEELPRLQSQQWNYKVLANIPSGYNGTTFCEWGDISVSILTVGIGRILIKDTIAHIQEKYGDISIEVDTDGVYMSDWVDIDYLNEYLAKRVEELFGVTNELELEIEEFNQGYFIKMKNYILYNTKGDLIIHGAALKSSRQPLCFDTSLELLAKTVLLKENNIKDTIHTILDINRYGRKDLILRTTINKPPSQYTATSFWGKLIKQAKTLKMTVMEGTQLEYIKCTYGYQLTRTVQSKREVDTSYYQKILKRLIVNFGLEKELLQKDTQDIEQEWL